ncbi:MAG TPA: thioredoxin domain-containing protein [Terriglobales bacterium]|nr:thioredoxin domain-containing protein [Terriglobales bacterium]
MASFGRNLLTIAVFLVFAILLGAGCKAQSASVEGPLSPETTHRIRTEIRSRYNVPPQIEITVGAPQPGPMSGYDKIVVTFTGGGRTSNNDFLISKDRKTLAHMESFDISQDLMSRIDVKGRPVRGNAASKVTIVNFDDFQCPFCSRMHQTLFPALLQQYGDRVKVIYKDYPLIEIHPWAMHAAIDGNCLAEQNNEAYWQYADYVHANQKQVAGANRAEAFANLDKAASEQATKHQLDPQKLRACMSKQDESAVRASMAEGDKLGVDSTPTLFVNGERLSGAVPEDQMRTIIERALAESSAPAAPGAKQAQPVPNAKK